MNEQKSYFEYLDAHFVLGYTTWLSDDQYLRVIQRYDGEWIWVYRDTSPGEQFDPQKSESIYSTPEDAAKAGLDWYRGSNQYEYYLTNIGEQKPPFPPLFDFDEEEYE